jgi:Domain of unknown function (DUF4352)
MMKPNRYYLVLLGIVWSEDMKTLESLLKSLLTLMTSVTLLAACGGGSVAEEPLPTSAAAPKATVLSPEQRNDQQIGNADYTIVVGKLEDPATAAAAYKPKLKDGRLVAVEVTFENVKSGDALDVNLANLVIIDDKNLLYPAYVGGRDSEVKSPALKKGEKVTGWAAFEIPKDAKATKVRYTVGLLATVLLEAPVPAK